MLELKEYQRGTLDALTRWLEALEDAKSASETMIEAFRQTPIDLPIPDEIRNYPKIAWQKLKENGGVAPTAGEYVDRTDEANRPIPHICFKADKIAAFANARGGVILIGVDDTGEIVGLDRQETEG